MTLSVTTHPLELSVTQWLNVQVHKTYWIKPCHHLSNIGFNEVLTHIYIYIHLSLKSSD